MRISDLLKCILFFIVCGSIFANSDPGVRRNKRRRGCRCKRVYKELSDSIDAKFKSLEQRFFMHLPQGDQNVNSSLNLKELNNKMGRLQNDVQITREALKQESQTLMNVREQLQAQKSSMDHLNSNFGLIENVVKNLTQVLDRLNKIDSATVQTTGNEVPIPGVISTTHAPTTTPSPRQQSTKNVMKSQLLKQYPKSCHDVYASGGLRYQGEYYIMIQPETSKRPFKVACKSIENSGGWTVIQRREDGSVDFYRRWAEYKLGFGHLSGEFWLGNEYIHQLTNQGPFKLRIDMEAWNGSKYYAEYDYFRIDNEANKYKLHVCGYHGNAGDSMTSTRDNHNGKYFSTFDQDNDKRDYNNCAEHYRGGWWYSDCYDSNLNGIYYKKGRHINFFKRNGIHWTSIHKHSSLKYVEMSVRPADDPAAAKLCKNHT